VQIAKEIGVSRTPLREAIRRLQQEGLLIGEVNRRIRVADAPLAEFDSLCALRIVNEALAIRLTIPQLTDDELARVEEMLERLEEGEPRAQEPWWEDLHREFHLGLITGAYGLLKGMIDSAYDHADRYERLYTGGGRRSSRASSPRATSTVRSSPPPRRAGPRRRPSCWRATTRAERCSSWPTTTSSSRARPSATPSRSSCAGGAPERAVALRRGERRGERGRDGPNARLGDGTVGVDARGEPARGEDGTPAEPGRP
jgi:DNA-binding Lrp family transcriptional regulator